jgi:sugar phosphate isomerase/epimerase
VRPHYRIGTTSFVHPAGWLDNAQRLAGRVQDVELLLFEPPGSGVGPSPDEISGLARLARDTGLTYTLHTPLEVALGTADEVRRAAGVDAVLRAIEVAVPLEPRAIVVHLYLGDREHGPRPVDLDGWRARAERSLREILAGGIPPAMVCLETLDYDFALAEPVVDALGLSVALDVGHYARDGVPFDAVLARNLHRLRVVQLHGTEPSGRDHRSLRHFPRPDAVRLIAALARAGFDGILTLEVFREPDLEDSLRVLAELEAAALAGQEVA